MRLKLSILVAAAFLTVMLFSIQPFSDRLSGRYCAAEKRTLSEAELYQKGLYTVVSNLKEAYELLPDEEQSKVFIYDSVEDLKRKVKFCCFEPLSLYGGQPKHQWGPLRDQNGLFFRGVVHMPLDQELSDRQKDGWFSPFVSFRVNACGEVRSVKIYNSKYYSNQRNSL